MKNLLPALAACILLASCSNSTPAKPSPTSTTNQPDTSKKSTDVTSVSTGPVADAATIMGRKQVPILCYHHIRDIQMVSKASMGYEVTVNEFKDQMKTLADSGFHTITPDQLYNYLTTGAALPDNPVMLTFDDTDLEQFTVGKTEMDKYGFKGVYFIMTISIGRPRYMSKEQIKQLSDEGHVIACHTWDHHRTDRYILGDRYEEVGGRKKLVNDWNDQLDKPRQKLEEITGKSVTYFAYPFGVWNEAGIPEIRKRGYKLAFQLSTKRDSLEPLYTVRRMIVSPEWSAAGLVRVMRSTFREEKPTINLTSK